MPKSNARPWRSICRRAGTSPERGHAAQSWRAGSRGHRHLIGYRKDGEGGDAPANDLRPQVVAASLTAAFNVLSERGSSSAKPKSAADMAALIDPVITFLRGGLDGLKEPARRR